MSDWHELGDLAFPIDYGEHGKPILSGRFQRMELCPGVLLVFDLDEPGMGFHFAALNWCAGPIEGPDWGPETGVEVLAHGVARFDGVRHLYFGDDGLGSAGYLYYPNFGKLVKLAYWLVGMEQRHCSMPDDHGLSRLAEADARIELLEKIIGRVVSEARVEMDGTVIPDEVWDVCRAIYEGDPR